MIKELMKDPIFLSQKAKWVDVLDPSLIQDLQDTLRAHAANCVGMAANMIGVNQRVIIIVHEGTPLVMVNPELRKTSGNRYTCEEGCLCHKGMKQAQRYEKIKVSYLDENMRPKIRTFQGFSAQIIQHELDHCEGILI